MTVLIGFNGPEITESNDVAEDASLDAVRERFRNVTHGSGIRVLDHEQSVRSIPAFEPVPQAVEDWMAWKHGIVIVERVQEKLDAATKRRQRGTTLTLDDVRGLLALTEVGARPNG